MKKKYNNKAKTLNTFNLAMITVSAIVSLRNLSLTAELGFSAVFYLIIAAIIFFIPSALIVAELTTAWPNSGGCYTWVSEAFGKPTAFLSLWLSWMANIAWFPATLAFMAAMLSYLFNSIIPDLEINNTAFTVIIMLTVLWSMTFLNFMGIKFSGFISSLGMILGTLIPGFIIIVLGMCWIFHGNVTEIPLTLNSFVPEISINNIIIFSGILLSLAGVELASYHISEAHNPQDSYPKALLIASLLILIIYIFGSLSIAMVVPYNKICLDSGLIQAFQIFLSKIDMQYFVPILVLCLFLGSLAGINAWIIGPAKGMLVIVQDNFLPPWLDKINQHGVPTRLLLLQAVFVSILSLIFLYISNNSTSIWLLTALSAQFTFVTYILIFSSAIWLRISKPEVKRVFKTPFMNLFAGLGIIVCILCFFVVFAPHTTLITIHLSSFYILLITSFSFLCMPVLYFINYRNKF